MSSLVSGTNNCGYQIALQRGLSERFSPSDIPTRSALCQMRQRVDFRFFKDLWHGFNERYESQRRTWKGLHVYAVDGIQLSLPRTDDIVKADYSGRKVSKYRESYMPKMFLTAALDVINGTVRDVRENPTLNEIADAQEMVSWFEDNSLTIYDRLYPCRTLIHAHNGEHNYFLFRLRESVISEMKVIFKSRKTKVAVEVDGITVHLIKMKNPKTGEYDCFATNLPPKLATHANVRKLYNLRWEVENAFRDFTQTIRLEEWHSKFINGIRQELYLALYLYNFTKLQILSKTNPEKECMKTTYKKPNFKLIFIFVAERISRIYQRLRTALKGLVELIDRSMESRTRHSRSYNREIKSPRSPFPYNNTRWNLP